ncbi:potassium voltage-gated channel subfamily Amember 3 [Striga asiatica]|uniref:Potassium voltage-gated channel subfamily Amember 3 n=1 Tax=Striga asiatica TaxID=4170 RepID=A0A5A7PYZ6_STRAF|nr:potassium voltage-gated channel subfamily Amember 3 [Striga asiatica]
MNLSTVGEANQLFHFFAQLLPHPNIFRVTQIRANSYRPTPPILSSGQRTSHFTRYYFRKREDGQEIQYQKIGSNRRSKSDSKLTSQEWISSSEEGFRDLGFRLKFPIWVSKSKDLAGVEFRDTNTKYAKSRDPRTRRQARKKGQGSMSDPDKPPYLLFDKSDTRGKESAFPFPRYARGVFRKGEEIYLDLTLGS